MIILTTLSLLFAGFLAARYFLGNKGGLFERAGAIIFFSISVTPFININLALLNNWRIANGLTFCVSILAAVLFYILILNSKKEKVPGKIIDPAALKDEWFALIVLGLVAIFCFNYYTDKESLLSLGSYLLKGDAKCFYMQTFETVRGLVPDLNSPHPRVNPYGIISTPGNLLFSTTFVSTFKLYGFKILYVLFNSLIFIFIYLLTKKLLGGKIIALATALFALFNPYALSIEVLDRNVMALAVSALMIYLVLEYKNKIFLHGLVFGILAGTGLRFLPLLFAIPVVILYSRERLNLKNFLVFVCAFLIAFTFNFAHLYYYGFQSLGETESSLALIKKAFTEWQRTPFLPFPNLLFYLFNILNYFGYLISGIILAGIFNLWKKDKKLFWAFFFMFFPALFILSFQRNWLEQDKSRILVASFLPLYIYFAYGLKAVFTKRYSLKKCLQIAICLLVPVVFSKIFSKIDFKQDEGFYRRRFLYQTESADYHALTRDFLLKAGVFPDYTRLFNKLDLKEKRAEEGIIFKKIFGDRGPQPKGLSANYNYIQVDFDKLVAQSGNAVKKVSYSDICAIDLKAEDKLFDVYYAGLKVGWQDELLPACVILRKDEIGSLGELFIELNAFVGMEKDETGCDIVYPVNAVDAKRSGKVISGKGMGSFPLYSENNIMVFRVPDDLKIVIRNWFINEKGVPYKVDGWCISPDKRGNYKAEFYYNEPESYL